MTITGDDRAFALRGLLAAMLTAQRREADKGTAAARRAAAIRADLLVELLVWTDRWIPAERREPDLADHPTPAEIDRANDAIEMLIAGLATLGKTFDPEGALVTALANLGLAPVLIRTAVVVGTGEDPEERRARLDAASSSPAARVRR